MNQDEVLLVKYKDGTTTKSTIPKAHSTEDMAL